MSKKITTHDANVKIAAREPFQTHGSFHAEQPRSTYDYNTGRLPQGFGETLEGSTYVVYSYNTPIAWVSEGKFYIPSVKYSITTSAHQNQARWGAQKSGLEVVHLGTYSERKMARQPSSTGGGWGSS